MGACLLVTIVLDLPNICRPICDGEDTFFQIEDIVGRIKVEIRVQEVESFGDYSEVGIRDEGIKGADTLGHAL